MENKELFINDNTILKEDKPTKIELYAQLFSILQRRIDNMTEEEYQEYKRKRDYE